MAQPTWLTPEGSLGIIPEGVFYQHNMLARTPVFHVANCTATSSATNTITCDSTEGLTRYVNVIFTGSVFGGIELGVRYFVLKVVSSTEFQISTTEFQELPISLTDATGNMQADFTQHVFFKLISGSLPPGIQCSDNGLIVGVPEAVASLQGVPFQVNRDVTNRFTVRAYTEVFNAAGQALYVDGIRDRTFSLTITGDQPPEWITPAGSIGTYYSGGLINFQLEYANNDPGDVVVATLVGGELPGGVTLSPSGLLYGYIEPAQNIYQQVGYDLTPQGVYPYDFPSASIDKNYQFIIQLSDGKNNVIRTFTMFVYDRVSLTADDGNITADNTDVTADETSTMAPFLLNARESNLGIVRSDNYYAYQFIGSTYSDEPFQYAISVNEGEGLPPGLTLDPNTGWLYGYIPDQGVTSITYSFNIQVFQISDPSICSQLYPFTITITGAIDVEVNWITPADSTAYTKSINGVNTTVYSIGEMDNGATSLFYVKAVNRGGRTLSYRLKSGAYNNLPQALELLPTGEIAGRTSFDTFSIDLGYTTFDKNQATVLNTSIGETTFDSTFVFTVNAYAEDTNQIIYKVDSITVIDGGTGYSVPPTITFSSPVGAEAVPAEAGVITVSGGKITSVGLNNTGNGYTEAPTYTITGAGAGAVLQLNMVPSGSKDVVSVDRICSIKVNRAYNKPYQNLYVTAMPPANDRQLILELLENQSIFQPDFLYRPTDPNFGKAKRVTYDHAFGLAPDTYSTYVESLYKNHYMKNLTLGPIETAQAVDPITGDVIYEVVYSKIIDDLVNNQGESVSKIVALPYPITDPADGSSILDVVYPNSLVNMREQVVDVVGQISSKLPLWMTSKQANGRVLGFTPAWVICYTKPGRSSQIQYYISEQFGVQLNKVDFKVDRYLLDAKLSKNWDPTKITMIGQTNYVIGGWTPKASLTTFDRFYTPDQVSIGDVNLATTQAFASINNQPLSIINQNGGFDGIVSQVNGDTLIFAQQEAYSGYDSTDAAWQNYITTFDTGGFDAPGEAFDESYTVPSGYNTTCTNTTSGTNIITCDSTSNMTVGDTVWFSGDDLSGLVSLVGTNVYNILTIESLTEFTLEDPNNPGTKLNLSTDAGNMTASFGNQRMGEWLISVDPATGIVTLTLSKQTGPNQYVTVTRGKDFIGQQLYYSTSPPPGLTQVTWVPVPQSSTTETTFDQGSMQFIAPVDMFNPTDRYDKYLVFPKANILE